MSRRFLEGVRRAPLAALVRFATWLGCTIARNPRATRAQLLRAIHRARRP